MTTSDYPQPQPQAQSQPTNVGYPQVVMSQPLPHSAMAIAGLVLGIIGLLTSFLPIINNISFILGILGLVFAAIGMTGCLRGKRTGKGMAIAALVLNILTVVVVLASQAAMSAAIDGAQKAFEGAAAVSSTAVAVSAAGQSSTDQPASTSSSTTDLPLGTEVTLSDGLVISVDSVTNGLQDYDGSPASEIRVTYRNDGTADATFNMIDWKVQDTQGVVDSATIFLLQDYDGSPASEIRVTYRNDGTADATFNMIDWKVQDTQGVVDSATIFLQGTDELHSGTLVPGGTVSGTVYFDGDAVKVLYYSSLFSSTAAATWVVD